jgi:hypothetical protein
LVFFASVELTVRVRVSHRRPCCAIHSASIELPEVSFHRRVLHSCCSVIHVHRVLHLLVVSCSPVRVEAPDSPSHFRPVLSCRPPPDSPSLMSSVSLNLLLSFDSCPSAPLLMSLHLSPRHMSLSSLHIKCARLSSILFDSFLFHQLIGSDQQKWL